MKHFNVITMGCKVNQCESAALEHLLEASGLVRGTSESQPDLVVINTCTVTGKAAMQSRQAIRQAGRKYPHAQIVVTGCYAQTAPEEIARIEDVDCIVGHADKLKIPEIIRRPPPPATGGSLMHQDIMLVRNFDALPSVVSEYRTRAFLKIQDGCNTFCTYCIVPHARGRSRSMPPADVLGHLNSLAEKSYREVVLTGIHLGAYGKDLEPQSSLKKLLEMTASQSAPNRVRLSSIEPTEVDPEIVSMMAGTGSCLCPHFHIPLQSGDDGILKRMGRPYDRRQFSGTIREIHSRLPYAAIGVDVLVGFPGESDGAFGRTMDLIEELPISYLHVFPFSPRKGTPAAGFGGRIPERIIKERCKRLRRLGDEKRRHFYCANIGREIDLLIENADNQGAAGLSENYIPVSIPAVEQSENMIIKVRIDKVTADLTVTGKLAADP